MKTLCSSPSRVFSRETLISKSLVEILGRNEIRFLSSPKQIGITFSNFMNMEKHKKRNKTIFSASIPPSSTIQETFPDEQTQILDTSKTVHVKFQLQRKCSFGEQFLLLGDDPMLGSWDPIGAIPLVWSDGDIWTVELDIPIGKVIKYKFIRKEITGDIVWQPGSDRVVQTWETTKMISVLEDWENAELQMILEEEFVLEKIADNITGSENSVRNIAENNADVAKDAPIEVKNEENELRYEGVPVLVPGLAPISTIDTYEKSSLESNDCIGENSSSEVEKLKEQEFLYVQQKKPEIKSPDSEDSTEMMIHIQEEEDNDRCEKKCDSADEKVQGFKQIENVYENDINWGRTTLQKLLNNFGF